MALSRRTRNASLLIAAVVFAALVAFVLYRVRATSRLVTTSRPVSSPEALDRHCREIIGAPRVLRVGERVFVAVGYDLANTILVRTDEGNVIIDAGMTPARARATREALLRESPGSIAAIILTHSHIDHVGGASVWADDGVPIWATASFSEHFFQQYGVFARSEGRRGAAQFGWHVGAESLPCSSLGRRVDLDGAGATGARMPTKTFSGETTLHIGGVTFELHEAHGETADHLFVWMPELSVLAPGDNFYRAFPNLYTLRGTAPRPVDAWIESLDRMRRLSPTHLVPSHTTPISGREEIATTLRDYRDAIQWVRDRVIHGASDGESMDEIAQSIGLPPHLASQPALQELYGQLDWSARALYTNHVGWFDERLDELYPTPPREAAARTIALMGGLSRVLTEAERARASGDARWAIHLLTLVRTGASDEELSREGVREKLATALEDAARGVANTNGRAYLLESAIRLRSDVPLRPIPRPDETLADSIPLSLLFEVMTTRLIPGRSIDVVESVRFELDAARFSLTIRHGVAELVKGDPLPGTPPPLAVVHASASTWRKLALRMVSPARAIASGALRLDGDSLAFARFIDRFEKEL